MASSPVREVSVNRQIAMFHQQDRHQLRRYYYQAWAKARAGRPLEPLESVIADVIGHHPEYHALLEEDDDDRMDKDYLPESGETNPFLHLGLHIAVREQLQANRPAGLIEAYRSLREKSGDAHAAEHQVMECLAETLWQAQRDGTAPDEQAYLASLRRLTGS